MGMTQNIFKSRFCLIYKRQRGYRGAVYMLKPVIQRQRFKLRGNNKCFDDQFLQNLAGMRSISTNYPTMVIRLVLVVLSSLVAVCTSGCWLKEQDVEGRWQATGFYENGQQVAVNLDSITLWFSPEGGYEFRSQGFYRESGSFRVSARYLFLTDTTVQPPVEHTLNVLYVSEDSLKIRMKQADNEQVLFFARRE